MESKKMMDKEINFFKKKGAPASMIKHEESEAKGMKFAKGGLADVKHENRSQSGSSRAGENTKIQKRGLTEGRELRMATGGAVKHFAKGGGIESRGKTKGRMV